MNNPPDNGPQRVTVYENMFEHTTVVESMCICPHCKSPIIYQHHKDTCHKERADYFQQRCKELEERLNCLYNLVRQNPYDLHKL